MGKDRFRDQIPACGYCGVELQNKTCRHDGMDYRAVVMSRRDMVRIRDEYLDQIGAKTVTFEGVCSGDMECFVFDDVPEEQWLSMCQRYRGKPQGPKGRLYPDEVLQHLGADYDKRRYRFTITVERVELESENGSNR